jgi:hypothetical protein
MKKERGYGMDNKVFGFIIPILGAIIILCVLGFVVYNVIEKYNYETVTVMGRFESASYLSPNWSSDGYTIITCDNGSVWKMGGMIDVPFKKGDCVARKHIKYRDHDRFKVFKCSE